VNEIRKRHVCPDGCGDEFYTTAHVVQEWLVNGLGNFIRTDNIALETTYGPDDGNHWRCAKCGKEAIMLDDAAYEGSFEYGGYHFVPYRKFEEHDGDFHDVTGRARSDFALGMSTYEWGKCAYGFNDFYDRSGNSDADLFRCVENGKLYFPALNELFEYNEPCN